MDEFEIYGVKGLILDGACLHGRLVSLFIFEFNVRKKRGGVGGWGVVSVGFPINVP